jgi:hypothetical protein
MALALSALSAAPAGAATVGSGYYGINAQWLFSTPQDTWPAQFQAMVQGGLTTVRTDARWSAAEPSAPSGGQHTYDWSFFDTIVGNLAKYGIRWMPTLDYPPMWAQEDPSDLGSEMKEGNVPDFVDYATALTRRYGNGGAFWHEHPELQPVPVREWEVWNEPNVTYYWNPQTNAPERYADLYLATRGAIKAVNPKAVVMAGGLALVNPPIASDEIDFIKRMFAHRPEVGTNVDVWGLHPYQESIYWTFRRFAIWRQALDKLAGRREPIAINELGYTTTKVSDELRGQELTELAQQLPRSGCEIYDFLPYVWLSPEADGSDPEQWFGIWNHNGTPKPSGRQFVDAVLQMRGLSSTPTPTDELNLCDSQYPVPADPQPPLSPRLLVPPPHTSPGTGKPVKQRGPGLRVSVRRDRKHARLVVTARCATPCKLGAYLMTRRTGERKLRTKSRTLTRRFKNGAQQLRVKLPAHGARLRPRAELIVVATDRSGASTRLTRNVLLP